MPSTACLSDFDTLNAHSATTGSAVMAPARALLFTAMSAASLASAIAGLYLVKSALGINLLTGPSPLHDLLYHLVR